MSTLNKQFSHKSWFVGIDMTMKEFLKEAAENCDMYISEKKILKKGSEVNMFPTENDYVLNKYLTDGRYKKKINAEQEEYFIKKKLEFENKKKEEKDKFNQEISMLYNNHLNSKMFVEDIPEYKSVVAQLDFKIRNAESNLTGFKKHNDKEMISYWEDRLKNAEQSYLLFYELKMGEKLFGTLQVKKVICHLENFVALQIKRKIIGEFEDDKYYRFNDESFREYFLKELRK